MIYSYSYHSPIGRLVIFSNNENILQINFNEDSFPAPSEQILLEQETAIIKQCIKELDEYFLGKRQYFTVKIKAAGAEFSQKCYQALQKIPYGEFRTYKDIAVTVNSPKAYRAVGMANNKNPIPIIIPCHRVIGSNGKLVGYEGGLEIKEFLLNLEKKYKN